MIDDSSTPKSMTTELRSLLATEGMLFMPTVYDGLSGRLAQHAGFTALSLGGYALGASSGVSEPLLSLEEVLSATRRLTAVLSIPVMVDAGAGYGDPVHVMRTVREFERAGAAAIHIEDQVFPKRVHYHKGIEHIISAEDMCEKIRYAVAARRDSNFVIVARTDAMRTDGFAEGIRRANLYREAGADLLMIFPNSEAEAETAPGEIAGPTLYVNSVGNRLGRPVLSAAALEGMGYKVAVDAIGSINAAAKAVTELFTRLRDTGENGMDAETFIPVRQHIEDAIGLDEYYRIEEVTVESRREAEARA